MPAITLLHPRNLVERASSSALFPVLECAVPQSETKLLVGYKQLLRGHQVNPVKETAIVYKPQDCVLEGLLREASSLAQNDLAINEPGIPFFYNGDQNLLALSVSQNHVGQSFDIYYLHWGFDRTHCVQLGRQANYFITAALQGCSIYVTGDPAKPTVFHLNANSVVGKSEAEAMTNKMKAMDSRFVSAAHALGVSQKNSASARMKDYMPGMINDTLTQEYGLSDISKSFWKVKDESLLQFGTVFGVRENGKWAFYFQKRTRQDYSYKTWMSGRTMWAKWTANSTRFWPPS